jgi:hypothetical protein
MALAYDQERATRDVDALFAPPGPVREAAMEVAAAVGLQPDWLNDAAKGFMPGPDESPATIFESEWLLVQVASVEYLLAMKLFASRDERDLDDAAVLFNLAGYTTAAQGVDLLSRSYPAAWLAPRHRFILHDIAARAASRRGDESAPHKAGE